MGKVGRLCNRVEPFAALFWALGLASLHHSTQSMSLYGHSWFNSQGRCIAAPPPPPLLSWYFIYLWYYEGMKGTVFRYL